MTSLAERALVAGRRRFLTGGGFGTAAVSVVVLGLLLFLVAYPLGMVAVQALYKRFPDLQPAASFDAFRYVWNSRVLREDLWNSAQVGLGVALVSVAVSVPAAFFVQRTDVPGRDLLDFLMLIPFTTSPFLAAQSWILIFQNHGYLEQLTGVSGQGTERFLFSYPGIVVVMAMHLFPLVYFSVAAALRLMPSSMLDAARTSGAGWLLTVRRVLLPFLLPAIFAGALLVMASAMSEFGAPATLGPRAHFITTSVDIAGLTSQYPTNRPVAAALSVMLMAWLVIVLVVARYLTAAGSRSGRTAVVTRIPLGRGRWPALVYVLALATIAGLVPWAAVVATSVLKTVSGGLSFSNLDLSRPFELFGRDDAREALVTSVELAAVAATAVVILGTSVAYLLSRTSIWGKSLIEIVTLLPSAAPGVVIAISIIVVWNQRFMPSEVYGSKWILAIAYVVVFLPFAVRYAASGLQAVSSALDDAGRTSGAGALRRFVRILLPLILPSLVSAWALTFAIGMRELENSLIVRPPGTTTAAVYMWQNFAQGNSIDGMGMAVSTLLVTCVALVITRRLLGRASTPVG